MSTNLDNIMTAANLPNGNYIPIDLNLINNPQYKTLSIEAMMLHALYTMRMTCSIYHAEKDGSWLNEAGHPYIYFSNEEAATLLRVSERKVTNLKNSLIDAGLIQVLRHGLKIIVSMSQILKHQIKMLLYSCPSKIIQVLNPWLLWKTKKEELKRSYPLWIEKQNLRPRTRKICLQVHKNI